MKATIIVFAALAATLAWAGDVRAQDASAPEQTEDQYATLYSQGMQAYVDGDYPRAIDLFYRAYGVEQKPVVARLIVRSFDFMGACDQAQRQRDFYRAEHADQRPVSLQQCSNPARVDIECGQAQVPVLVDGTLEGRCGETIALAPGRHVITSPALDEPARVDVQAGESRAVSLAVDPKKWSPPDRKRPQKWQRERAEDDEDGEDGDVDKFSVYQSRDGLYRVWVRYDLLKDPDMHSGDDEPRVLRLCDVDQTYDDAKENCVPLEPLQIEKVQ